jgi:hypothetical protein
MDSVVWLAVGVLDVGDGLALGSDDVTTGDTGAVSAAGGAAGRECVSRNTSPTKHATTTTAPTHCMSFISAAGPLRASANR